MIYIGIYSVRPGTYAARKYEDNIPIEVKKDRRNRLNELLKRISAENNIKEIGSQRITMLTKKVKSSPTTYEYFWYTDNMKQVKIIYAISPQDNHDSPVVWSFVPVKITGGKQFILFGEIIW